MADKQQEKREKRIEKKYKKEDQKSEERKGMYKKLGIAALIIISIPLFALLGKLLSKPTEGLDQENRIEITGDDHKKGPADAPITIVEYSDFQCPACGTFYPIVKGVQDAFPNDVQFVYRHLPLKQIHPNAERAAQAAEAAANQDAFFKMHDMLFEKQEEWAESEDVDSLFIMYAEELSLDVDVFVTDIDSVEVADRVDNDIKTAYTLNLQSTPSFFMNGKKIENPRGLEAFKQLIEEELNT